ncbi:hypothetical protein ACPCSP_25755 [Streptomyces cinereoruber]|uniref:hypothetical protein n=1 Tax=Streptomyces cinereoruber TaxID=67260 RepID=UPI003C2DB4B3
MSTHRARLALVSCLTAAAAAVAGFTMNSTASATPSAAPATTTTEETGPPPAVETLNYPNAAAIQQAQGILLKRGDGNILLVTCDGTNDIVVKNRVSPSTQFCFDVRSKPGFLTLELNDAFGLRTRDYPVTATITANGQQTVIKAAADDYKPFGEGVEGPRSALVELRVTG